MFSKNQHVSAYTFLFLSFITFGILGYVFRFNVFAMSVLAVCISVYYVLWGIAFHHVTNRLNKLVVIEYIAFATCICVLALTVLNI